jgi:Type VI secretion system effector, Hcp
LASGKHISSGQLTFRTEGTQPVEYYTIKMSEIIVTEVTQMDTPDPARIVEKVVLNARAYSYEYQAQNDKRRTRAGEVRHRLPYDFGLLTDSAATERRAGTPPRRLHFTGPSPVRGRIAPRVEKREPHARQQFHRLFFSLRGAALVAAPAQAHDETWGSVRGVWKALLRRASSPSARRHARIARSPRESAPRRCPTHPSPIGPDSVALSSLIATVRWRSFHCRAELATLRPRQ